MQGKKSNRVQQRILIVPQDHCSFSHSARFLILAEHKTTENKDYISQSPITRCSYVSKV